MQSQIHFLSSDHYYHFAIIIQIGLLSQIRILPYGNLPSLSL